MEHNGFGLVQAPSITQEVFQHFLHKSIADIKLFLKIEQKERYKGQLLLPKKWPPESRGLH